MGRNRVPAASPRKRQPPEKRTGATRSGQGAPAKPAALVWADQAWEDYLWFSQNKPALHKRINRLIEEIQQTPYTGIGKPEPLKHELAGYWSRRVDDEHRLVYQVKGSQVLIAQCRFHYKKT
ncbi:MAG: Txe/YoeB family addiction module toxin [Burkholderiales bacterium]|nr:Txe/YoeB family addiction module toxin [Burkholderiales bacterium]